MAEATGSEYKLSPDFYLNFIVFKVEDTLYRVPKSYFEQNSPIYRDMFSLPQKEGEGEGSSNDNPLILEGVKKDDFDLLLNLVYPKPSFDTGNNFKIELVSMRRLDSALRLSRRWIFRDLYRFLIGVVDSRDATRHLLRFNDPLAKDNPEIDGPLERTAQDMVCMGREHHVPSWIRSGYCELIRSSSPLSEADLDVIGWKQACRILQLREEQLRKVNDPSNFYIQQNYSLKPPVPEIRQRYIPDKELDALASAGVERLFAEELEEAEKEEKAYYSTSL